MDNMTKREYIKRTVKYLKCSPEKKREIERQLLSDIEIAIGEGRQLGEILAEMGEPEALAAEFNDNLDENEKRKPKRRRLRIILTAALLVLAVIAGAAYWILPKSRDIRKSKVFEEDVLRSRSEEVIMLFGAEDYEGLYAHLSEEMRGILGEGAISGIKSQIGQDWGGYRAMGNAYMAEIRQRGVRYALVQTNVSYDNISVTYTLSFDEDMKVIGFYVR